MKYLTVLLLFILACNDPVYKETYKYTDCGVSIESPYLSDELVFPAEETLVIAIRLVQMTNDTSFSISPTLITKAIDSLNSGFKIANITFKVIENTVYRTNENDITNYKQDILAYKKEMRNEEPAIDVFIYKPNFEFYPGVALSIKSDALAIQAPFFTSNTLIHELGHCLGLHHTHDNSGNGYEAGDFICDTPETGIISGYIDANCLPRGKISTMTEEETQIIVNNYMSYVNKACRREFTKDQIDKMRFHISRESLLRNTLIF